MTETDAEKGDPELPPSGSRWGRGAQSVLPYLLRTLRARPSAAETGETRAGDGTRGQDGRPSA